VVSGYEYVDGIECALFCIDLGFIKNYYAQTSTSFQKFDVISSSFQRIDSSQS
jgi:hypothetical protein